MFMPRLKPQFTNFSFLMVAVLLSILGVSESANAKGMIKCTMDFELSSWSVFYKKGDGTGSIECDNGQKAKVEIKTRGGGFTFGKSKIVDGHGKFSKVVDISDLYGGYAAADAHASAGESAEARVMTKGEVSMALSGTGKGISVGFAFGSFQIEPIAASPAKP